MPSSHSSGTKISNEEVVNKPSGVQLMDTSERAEGNAGCSDCGCSTARARDETDSKGR